MSHTKEPWAIGRDDRPGMQWNNHIVSLNDQNQTICFMSHDNTPENEEGEANAQRIVACVNACAGIQTEHLERCNAIGAVDEILAERNELKKQRDELLAALECVLTTRNAEAKASMEFNNAAENYSDDSIEHAAYEKAMIKASNAESEARAAIASVKGSA